MFATFDAAQNCLAADRHCHRVKQKPHPGEKPSEAFALAPDGLDSGRKLDF
jgi:hypothetical protein